MTLAGSVSNRAEFYPVEFASTTSPSAQAIESAQASATSALQPDSITALATPPFSFVALAAQAAASAPPAPPVPPTTTASRIAAMATRHVPPTLAAPPSPARARAPAIENAARTQASVEKASASTATVTPSAAPAACSPHKSPTRSNRLGARSCTPRSQAAALAGGRGLAALEGAADSLD